MAILFSGLKESNKREGCKASSSKQRLKREDRVGRSNGGGMLPHQQAIIQSRKDQIAI